VYGSNHLMGLSKIPADVERHNNQPCVMMTTTTTTLMTTKMMTMMTRWQDDNEDSNNNNDNKNDVDDNNDDDDDVADMLWKRSVGWGWWSVCPHGRYHHDSNHLMSLSKIPVNVEQHNNQPCVMMTTTTTTLMTATTMMMMTRWQTMKIVLADNVARPIILATRMSQGAERARSQWRCLRLPMDAEEMEGELARWQTTKIALADDVARLIILATRMSLGAERLRSRWWCPGLAMDAEEMEGELARLQTMKIALADDVARLIIFATMMSWGAERLRLQWQCPRLAMDDGEMEGELAMYAEEAIASLEGELQAEATASTEGETGAV
jgi:hypothetical protein